MLLETISIVIFTLIIGAIAIWVLRTREPPAGARRNPMQMRRQEQADAGDEEEEEEKMLSKKDQRKEEKKQERERMREMRNQHEQEKEKKLQKQLERWEASEKRWEEKERQEEELRKKQEEERQKKEEEEFAKWKDMIQIEETGEDLEDLETSLGKFIDYIKLRKVVFIEELAAEFNLDSKSIVSRLKDLESQNRITGVIDDRGKFIYIPEEELMRVKNYIEKKGRVSRSELVSESNRLISLQPSAENQQIIRDEESKLIEGLE